MCNWVSSDVIGWSAVWLGGLGWGAVWLDGMLRSWMERVNVRRDALCLGGMFCGWVCFCVYGVSYGRVRCCVFVWDA